MIAGIVADTPCCTVATIRRRLQAPGIERSRRIVQGYMAAEHRPAKHVICGQWRSLHHCISCSGSPQGKNQHLTALNSRRRQEQCTSMLQWLGEAKKAHSGCCSCKTRISRSFQAHSSPSFTILCKRCSHRSLSNASRTSVAVSCMC